MGNAPPARGGVPDCQCPSAAAGGGICSGGGGGLHPGAALFPWLLPAGGAQIISGRDGAASSLTPATLIPTPASPKYLSVTPLGVPPSPLKMSGWQDYVDMLMADGSCQEAAIVGYVDAKYVWATTPGGFFQTLTVSVECVGCTCRERTIIIVRDNGRPPRGLPPLSCGSSPSMYPLIIPGSAMSGTLAGPVFPVCQEPGASSGRRAHIAFTGERFA